MGGAGQHHRLKYLCQTVHSLLCISALNLEHLLRIDTDMKNKVCFVKNQSLASLPVTVATVSRDNSLDATL